MCPLASLNSHEKEMCRAAEVCVSSCLCESKGVFEQEQNVSESSGSSFCWEDTGVTGLGIVERTFLLVLRKVKLHSNSLDILLMWSNISCMLLF